jgi:hypothetical protein
MPILKKIGKAAIKVGKKAAKVAYEEMKPPKRRKAEHLARQQQATRNRTLRDQMAKGTFFVKIKKKK